ncbi:metal ABC transporter substrate-binding protein [Desulfofundulus thermocisternus]|uniref:metal ABC transporter substrate-binding protein n=1 Tax=Desulfofundulus thermocisternus TaxID=42471 RepID=UPI0019DA89CA|nr:metal ABC transporter substrate-binding protein [Desulfofundulus thermocisternus]MBE3586810.1 zinc ABC transporter substrate-binding protein [Thermoanaerobacter sp.]MCS5695501.1 metal ABC transporter substrate-binding protein [Desulfofundulus thermocisternus]
MKAWKTFLFLVGLLLLWLPGCSGNTAVPGAGEKIAVVTTIYPLYDFARQVGGERVEVTRLLPAGAEPHTWEPTPKDMAALARARVFIYNGAGMEPWVQRQLGLLEEKGVRVVEASRGLDLIAGPGDHGEAGVDPHVWLDPVLAQEIVKKIRDAYIAVDPDHAAYYSSRADEYLAALRELDREYRAAAQDFQRREIVTSHAAFAYLARRYGLQQVALMGLSPESEPDPVRMREIVAFCREHDVKYVFFEALVSPKVSRTLAREVGAETLVLNPLGNITPEEEKRGENYLSIMRENLARLKVALGDHS